MFKLPGKHVSLRTRFLMATTVIILALTLPYGIVAIVGYLMRLDNDTYAILSNQSNLFYSLARWKENKLDILFPVNFHTDNRSLTLIYDDKNKILWRQHYAPELEKKIPSSWLKKNGLYELEAYYADINSKLYSESDNKHTTNNHAGTNKKNNISKKNKSDNNNKVITNSDNIDERELLTYSVAINIYPATKTLPAMTIAVINTLPQNILPSEKIWEWFGYVLIANLILVAPLIWLAADWSLRPIKSLVLQISSLEKGEREELDENPPSELKGLIKNLNALLDNERQRYTKYRTTLSDLTHSLKTPLAVLQSTLRSLRSSEQMTIEQAEPIMLEQIDRISQQIGYYLHRANIYNDHNLILKKVFSVPTLLDSLINALTKVYQHKGVNITLDISPELTWLGEKNDFLEIIGNILENACKYCLEFVEVTALTGENFITIIIDDDGPGIPPDKRSIVFERGLRADTLRPGQGLGLSIASEIVEQYEGNISIGNSHLGGARVSVTFRNQRITNNAP
ncbi:MULTISPECIES: two-component system sensor histidine kinase PhoQ [Xenorhabdus]|uniref:two-component system sensor histidine kinase PhoQ n=1 Tax=Xenorhabdus TaxID=626 RepID=UPI0006464523|nr:MULTISPECIES: two-component system sensor histidine kinase PhoQ [Xenorhabdus]